MRPLDSIARGDDPPAGHPLGPASGRPSRLCLPRGGDPPRPPRTPPPTSPSPSTADLRPAVAAGTASPCWPGGVVPPGITQRVETLEREGQVRAALAAGQCVHLVDDDGL